MPRVIVPVLAGLLLGFPPVIAEQIGGAVPAWQALGRWPGVMRDEFAIPVW